MFEGINILAIIYEKTSGKLKFFVFRLAGWLPRSGVLPKVSPELLRHLLGRKYLSKQFKAHETIQTLDKNTKIHVTKLAKEVGLFGFL